MPLSSVTPVASVRLLPVLIKDTVAATATSCSMVACTRRGKPTCPLSVRGASSCVLAPAPFAVAEAPGLVAKSDGRRHPTRVMLMRMATRTLRIVSTPSTDRAARAPAVSPRL
ncbi:hypothetical protein D3C86_1781950 [compost metagenome]